MKYLISTFIIFIIALRPVMPFIDYAVNYDNIVKNLCENRNVKDSTCNGKCYLKKELAKTENQTKDDQTVKTSSLDTFITNEIFTFQNQKSYKKPVNKRFIHGPQFHYSNCFSKVFRPPVA